MAKLICCVVLLLAISTAFAEKHGKVKKTQPPKDNVAASRADLNHVIDKVHVIGSELKKQEHLVYEQSKKIKSQEKRLNDQDQTIAEQSDLISHLQQVLREEAALNQNQDRKIENYASKLHRKSHHQSTSGPIIVRQSTAFACLYGVLNLTCPVGSSVLITEATYGQYDQPCTEGCCQPNTTQDCLVAMETEDTEGWANLRVACNYEQTCNFQLQAHQMTSCPAEELVDYMLVSYDCYGGGFTSDVVAFTAYAITTRSYGSGATLQFDYTVTNKGNHYHTLNDTFVCPYDGLYMFYVNVMGDDFDSMTARIVMDDELLVSAFADDDSNSKDNHAANMVFADCNAYQQVWVESAFSGAYMSSSADRLSSFSGHMITRY